jgi:hypothetical protein
MDWFLCLIGAQHSETAIGGGGTEAARVRALSSALGAKLKASDSALGREESCNSTRAPLTELAVDGLRLFIVRQLLLTLFHFHYSLLVRRRDRCKRQKSTKTISTPLPPFDTYTYIIPAVEGTYRFVSRGSANEIQCFHCALYTYKRAALVSEIFI